jgi:hypothetical protein
MNLISTYLEQYQSFFNGKTLESLTHKHGEFMNSQKFDPKKYKRISKTKKECYRNAYYLVQKYPELTYCEGFAISAHLPIGIHHAWAVDENNNVVDPTWDNPEESEYFGIKLNIDLINEVIVETGMWGILTNVRDFVNHMKIKL